MWVRGECSAELRNLFISQLAPLTTLNAKLFRKITCRAACTSIWWWRRECNKPYLKCSRSYSRERAPQFRRSSRWGLRSWTGCRVGSGSFVWEFRSEAKDSWWCQTLLQVFITKEFRLSTKLPYLTQSRRLSWSSWACSAYKRARSRSSGIGSWHCRATNW